MNMCDIRSNCPILSYCHEIFKSKILKSIYIWKILFRFGENTTIVAQKKKFNPIENKEPKVQAQNTFVPPTEKGKSINFLLNVVVLFVSFFVVFLLAKKIGGYKWVRETLLKENLDYIKKFPKLTTEEKLESRLGFDYAYIKMLKESPENAVILMPRRSFIDSVRKDNQALSMNSAGIFNGTWSEYFLYPRKVVFEDNKQNPLYNKVTHVAILSYKGYEKLNYQVADSSKKAYGIVPISK